MGKGLPNPFICTQSYSAKCSRLAGSRILLHTIQYDVEFFQYETIFICYNENGRQAGVVGKGQNRAAAAMREGVVWGCTQPTLTECGLVDCWTNIFIKSFRY
jgi:hypothetical protein